MPEKPLALAICHSILLLLSAHSAIAQNTTSGSDDKWKFYVAPYLYGADLGGELSNGTTIEVEFKDLVDHLEFAFMGALEARKGRWSVLVDILYLDVSASDSTIVSVPAGPTEIEVATRAKLSMKGLVFQIGATYNLLEGDRSRLDLLGGARYLDVDTDVFLSLQALGPGESITIAEDDNFLDAIVGVKGRLAFAERWHIPYYIDIGTGDSDFTWQAMTGIGFQASERTDLVLLYRHIEWDLGSDSFLNDLDFSGPAFGAVIKF